MNITVKYFASLREQLGKSEEMLTLSESVPVATIWQNVSGFSETENILMAINMEYVKSDAIVKEGDEVAFFPPVTGG
ncbi:MAG: molybdopterin converting factor subunit 1 [Gammaproteobacteria bacterium]|jgi:molybdopterin synthase sulfur carrier subunit|nr:molybdopterin converting factor subunit 1 [Gammaproteobacteria bacterium]